MTNLPVGYLSDLCRTSVGQIIGPLVVVFLGTGAAQAGPDIWQNFEARCIAPIENVESADVSGLVAEADETSDLEVFHDPAGFFTLLRDKIGIQKTSLCRITNFYDSDAGGAFEAWASAVIGDGQYVLKKNNSPAILIQSTIWREPRIEIEADFLGLSGSRYFEVRETDLES